MLRTPRFRPLHAVLALALTLSATLAQAQAMAGRRLTLAQAKTYATTGGVPSLDGQYTVFGEVTEGLDVVEKIANEPVESDKWPVKDISIKVEVVK